MTKRRTRPSPRQRRPAGLDRRDRERKAADGLLRNCCAWCLRRIPARAPVVAIPLSVKDPAALDRTAAFIAVEIGGRRVPGVVAKRGSAFDLIGHDIGFMLCGKPCARALRAALERDRHLSTVH